MGRIKWLSDIRGEDRQTAGGKGANLAELWQLGMPVPDGFVVTVQAYTEQANRMGLVEALSSGIERKDWSAVEKTARVQFASCRLDEGVARDVRDAYRRMGSPAVAVRSSSTAEDHLGASFAGQHDSFLNVRGEEELLRAVTDCWASLWNRRALAYRHSLSIDPFHDRMAVIVQRMVPADAAGVVFNVDPVEERADRLRIEVAPGLGEAIVSGTVTSEVYRVDRESLAVAGREGSRKLLDEKRVEELGRLALAVEAHYGRPQDIEFCLKRGEIFLLQARPQTALGKGLPEPLPVLGKPSLFDKAMKPLVDERYPLAPRPLDNITFTRVVGAAIYTLRQAGGIVTPEDEEAFRAQVFRQAYRFPPIRRGWLPPVNYPRQFVGLLKSDWQAWWESGPRDELRAVTAPVDLPALGDADLLKRADRILAAWEQPLNRRFYASGAIQAESWLKKLVTLAVGRKERDQVLADLMTGLPNPTVEVNEALWELSRLARRDPSVKAAVREVAPDRLGSLPGGDAFLAAFRSFLDAYGHRESSCWYLSTPTWRQDPAPVWRLLSSLVDAEERPGDPARARARYQEARERVERRLRYCPGLPFVFRWMVERLRALHAFRETSHFDLSRPLDALQEIAAEWGRRLIERGVLGEVDDVFYLTHGEVRAWLTGKPPSAETVRDLLARRRATYRKANARWLAEQARSSARRGEIKGVGASPGVVRAKARIIRGEHEFERLRPGEILICQHTNPSWTPLFTAAAGVVAETGGAASHAAIVAREYGIPAVMAASGATKTLADGEEILVDGSRGVVVRAGAGK